MHNYSGILIILKLFSKNIFILDIIVNQNINTKKSNIINKFQSKGLHDLVPKRAKFDIKSVINRLKPNRRYDLEPVPSLKNIKPHRNENNSSKLSQPRNMSSMDENHNDEYIPTIHTEEGRNISHDYYPERPLNVLKHTFDDKNPNSSLKLDKFFKCNRGRKNAKNLFGGKYNSQIK